MEVTTAHLYQVIGQQQVQAIILQDRVQQLEAQVKELQAPVKVAE